MASTVTAGFTTESLLMKKSPLADESTSLAEERWRPKGVELPRYAKDPGAQFPALDRPARALFAPGRHQIIRYGGMSLPYCRVVIYTLLLQSQSRFLPHNSSSGKLTPRGLIYSVRNFTINPRRRIRKSATLKCAGLGESQCLSISIRGKWNQRIW